MLRILFGVSFIGLIFSFAFVVISVWNNYDWLLLERGYYTFGIITIAISVYLAIQLVLELKTATMRGKLNMAICAIFAGISIIYIAISIRNTEWVLLEKGYYWMGMAFVTITSAMLSATIKSVFIDEKDS